MSQREDRQEVILGSPNGALGLVSTVVLRGNVLELGGGLVDKKKVVSVSEVSLSRTM